MPGKNNEARDCSGNDSPLYIKTFESKVKSSLSKDLATPICLVELVSNRRRVLLSITLFREIDDSQNTRVLGNFTVALYFY